MTTEPQAPATRIWLRHMDTGDSYEQGQDRDVYGFMDQVYRYDPQTNCTYVVQREVVYGYKRKTLVTLSACAETGKKESSIPVPNQRSYKGHKPAISSTLADTPCAELGVDGVLQKLNEILETSYDLDMDYAYLDTDYAYLDFFEDLAQSTVHGKPRLRSALQGYVERSRDFGFAYAHLRPYWHSIEDTSINGPKRHKQETYEADQKWRKRVFYDIGIDHGSSRPRRVWDLYANRVVPYWVAGHDWILPEGISHAWVDENDRKAVWTPINGYRWPVPIPKDADLNLIRIELLNLAKQYVWLDVLCLRQKGGLGELLREEEWKLDVPTIGSVYSRGGETLCYFCGLGMPVDFKTDYFASDHCWFKRAWTLQEVTDKDPVIAGQTGQDKFMDEKVKAEFEKELDSLVKTRSSFDAFGSILQMQKRVSTNPLDKVAGLGHILGMKYIPIYDMKQSAEKAWEAFMDSMDHDTLRMFLFFYPEPGNGSKRWLPSWGQAMAETFPSYGDFFSTGSVEWSKATGHWYFGHRITSGDVRGLGEGSNAGQTRQGELIIKDRIDILQKFKVIAKHQYPIPDGSYTLIGSGGSSREQRGNEDKTMRYWVVGRNRSDGKFEKLSVLSMADDEERKRLRELGVVELFKRTVLC